MIAATPSPDRKRRRAGTALWLALTVLVAIALTGCNADVSAPSDVTMMPWRSDAGTFGFVTADTQRQLVAPRFADARPGVHGYAPVANADGQWGLVDANGRNVLARDHAVLDLIDTGTPALVVTKTEYNAWWRFWDWRVLPDYNIISTSNSGPWLVTYVPRAVWRVINPATGETLVRRDRADRGITGDGYWRDGWQPERQRPEDLWIGHWPDGAVLIDETLYATHADTARFERIAEGIRTRLADGSFLQRAEADTDRRVDATGRPVNDHRYTERRRAVLEDAHGQSLTLVREHTFEDENGRFYLLPDLDKPLPTTLADFVFADGQRMPADTLNTTQFAPLLQALPNSPWFVLVLRIERGDAQPSEPYVFFFDSDGHWAPDWQPRPGLYSIADTGNILFRYAKPFGVLDADLHFSELPMQEVARRSFGDHLYGGIDAEGRSGLYDIQQARWVVRSADVRLHDDPLIPGVAAYAQDIAPTDPTNTDCCTRYGLFNTHTGARITPPRYISIDDDGRVRRPENDTVITYYIDLHSGREYRADATPGRDTRAPQP
ncbi:KWG repeat-containing protein [Salinisphaera sp. T5B8]|uniref:hypothetical protein n=1 Tax=Salinisphaera sp. T5B8 TaxID=1304154 RepID=UPI00333EBDC4